MREQGARLMFEDLVGGATSGAYWITNRILYAVDYQRGIDILRYTGKL